MRFLLPPLRPLASFDSCRSVERRRLPSRELTVTRTEIQVNAPCFSPFSRPAAFASTFRTATLPPPTPKLYLVRQYAIDVATTLYRLDTLVAPKRLDVPKSTNVSSTVDRPFDYQRLSSTTLLLCSYRPTMPASHFVDSTSLSTFLASSASTSSPSFLPPDALRLLRHRFVTTPRLPCSRHQQCYSGDGTPPLPCGLVWQFRQSTRTGPFSRLCFCSTFPRRPCRREHEGGREGGREAEAGGGSAAETDTVREKKNDRGRSRTDEAPRRKSSRRGAGHTPVLSSCRFSPFLGSAPPTTADALEDPAFSPLSSPAPHLLLLVPHTSRSRTPPPPPPLTLTPRTSHHLDLNTMSKTFRDIPNNTVRLSYCTSRRSALVHASHLSSLPTSSDPFFCRNRRTRGGRTLRFARTSLLPASVTGVLSRSVRRLPLRFLVQNPSFALQVTTEATSTDYSRWQLGMPTSTAQAATGWA